MATSAERKALLFFATVIALGAGARAVRVRRSVVPTDAPAREALETQLEAADSARRSKFVKSKVKKGHPGAGLTRRPSGKLDLDVATEAEIEALRGVGPSLAHRIVMERDSFGPFGSLEGLRRVRGVGPALVAKLDSAVTFSLLPRPMNTVIPSRSGRSSEPRRRRPKSRLRDTLR